jgi:hypothetical protein
MRRLRRAAAALTFAAACSSDTPVTEPELETPPKVGGRTYVLRRVAGGAAPFLLTDQMTSDGTRRRHWIVADTVSFGTDGRLRYATLHEFSELPPAPAEEDRYTHDASGGGYFEQQAERVMVAWNLVSSPTPIAYGDTLRFRRDTRVRRAALPPSCFGCGSGPTVEFLYTSAGAP